MSTQTYLIPSGAVSVDVSTAVAFNLAPNSAPTVSAGTNKTIQFPTNSVLLDGAATDSDGVIVSYLWSQVAGGASSIATPNQEDTLVTFTTEGSYTFKLSATDDDGAVSSSQTIITVLAAPINQPPTVNAGPDQSINAPASSVVLTGSASDSDGSIASYTWTKVSGGVGTIVSPNSASTSVTGLAPGTYVFKLSVIDNAGATAEDTVSIVVVPQVIVPSTYQGFGAAATKGGESFKATPTHVTNLNASGGGSLLDALKSNRYIIFDVSGTISGFRYTGSTLSNVTIDGSGKSITLTGNAGSTFAFENTGNHDIVITNLRFQGNPGEDHITITDGAYNFVIDHCSFATPGTTGLVGDGLLDITAGSHDITVQYCLFGHSTSGSMLIAYSGTKNLSVHHNLFSPAFANQVGERNPFVHSSDTGTRPDLMVELVNNVGFNWGRNAGTGSGYFMGVDYGGSMQCINNYGISKSDPSRMIDTNADPQSGSNGQCYAEGNVSGTGENINAKSNHAKWAIPVAAQITAQSACDAAKKVLAEAGAFPRTSSEQSLINSIVLTGC